MLFRTASLVNIPARMCREVSIRGLCTFEGGINGRGGLDIINIRMVSRRPETLQFVVGAMFTRVLVLAWR